MRKIAYLGPEGRSSKVVETTRRTCTYVFPSPYSERLKEEISQRAS